MQNVLLNTSKMANRVGFKQMLEEEMFLHLLTWNCPNLVEIEQKQN